MFDWENPRETLNFNLLFRGSHRCKERERLVLKASTPRNNKVADNYVVTSQGFRAIYKTSEDHVYCHPIEVEALDTEYLGFSLPWHLIGAAK